jgi:hypothetical protein
MFSKTKVALAAALVLGSASMAFAEDSSSSFAIDTYAPAALQQNYNQPLTSREVALPRSQATQATVHGAGNTFDRASQVLDGGGN